MTPPGPRFRWSRIQVAAYGAICLGALLRCVAFAHGYSLWQDEILLSLNIARRSYAALTHPLAHDQAAPILYLWVAHLFTTVGGVNEYTLRLPALIAGALVPLAIWHFGRRIVGEPAAVMATIFAALSPTLIGFSNQVKPYSSDALIAVTLAGLAYRLSEQPTSTRAWLTFMTAALIAPFASFPTPFTLAACAAFLLLSPGVLRTAGWRRAAGTAVPILIASAAAYLFTMRGVASNAYLQDFWRDRYLAPTGQGLASHLYDFVREVTVSLSLPAAIARPRLLVPLFLIGAVALWYRRGNAVAALCLTALVAAATASALGRYPLAVRLLLFSASFSLFVTCSGLALTLVRIEQRWVGATAVAGFVMVLAVLNTRVTHLTSGRVPIEGRGAVMAVRNARAHEPVYVAPAAVATWAFYSTDWTHPDLTYLDFIARKASSGGVAFFAGPSRRHGVDVAESSDLRLDRNAGPELIGVHTGVAFREGSTLSLLAPDSGWVEMEAARILATCARREWIISTLRVKSEADPLLKYLVAAGARVLSRYDELQASAIHLELPRTPAASCAHEPA